eukprot:825265-Prymnesium_polylepis.1
MVVSTCAEFADLAPQSKVDDTSEDTLRSAMSVLLLTAACAAALQSAVALQPAAGIRVRQPAHTRTRSVRCATWGARKGPESSSESTARDAAEELETIRGDGTQRMHQAARSPREDRARSMLNADIIKMFKPKPVVATHTRTMNAFEEKGAKVLNIAGGLGSMQRQAANDLLAQLRARGGEVSRDTQTSMLPPQRFLAQ